MKKFALAAVLGLAWAGVSSAQCANGVCPLASRAVAAVKGIPAAAHAVAAKATHHPIWSAFAAARERRRNR